MLNVKKSVIRRMTFSSEITEAAATLPVVEENANVT